MKKNNIFDANYLWLMFVLLHFAGASLASMASVIPMGSIFLLCGVSWIIYLYIREQKYAILSAGVICSILLFLNQSAGAFFRPSLLLNMMMLTFVFYTAKQSHVELKEYVGIKMPSWKQGILCVFLTVLTLCMAMYINSLSMLFSKNFVTDSLQYVEGHEWIAILILAVIPACVEEIMFRACLYRALPDKVLAVIITAICFALLHTNVNQICYALFMGLCFGLVVYFTDQITLTIMMHILFNLYTVLMSIFQKSAWVQKILNIECYGYHPFNPVYAPDHMQSAIIAGAVFFVMAGLLSAGLLYCLKKTGVQEKVKYIGKDPIWKIDWRFILASLLCMVTAAYWQIFSK